LTIPWSGSSIVAIEGTRTVQKLKKILRAKNLKFLIKVETSDNPVDYSKYERIRNDIWGFPEDNLSGTRNLMCENVLFDGSALFIAVYREAEAGGFVEDDEQLIGFSYGFVGVRDKALAFRSPGNLQFYSQYTAIRDDFRGYGLGVRIKEFQRDLVRGWFGIGVITCTFDPLTGVNALRNIHYFGMDVVEYQVATYGEFGGLLNRADVSSDRFLVSWDLEKPAGQPGRAGIAAVHIERQSVVRIRNIIVAGRSRPVEIETVDGLNLGAQGGVLAVPIPRDFYLMLRETDVGEPEVRRIPIDWRLATRAAFQMLFRKGYRVIDFVPAGGPVKTNYYLLKKDERRKPEAPRRRQS